MDQFTHDDLHRLVESSGDPAVAIYLPTNRAGRDVRENATRFKNLLKLATQRVADRFPGHQPLRARLQEAAKLETDEAWWQRQSDGLAMFISAGRLDCYRVPLKFEEFVAAGRRLYVLPMVRLLQGDGRFYILAVSQNRVRILIGTHYSIDALDADQMPSDLCSALNIDEYVSSLQQHTTGSANTAGRTMFHGHGGSGLDVKKKDEIRQFFHRIDDALSLYCGSEGTPLVFAGVDYLFPIFRETCHYRGLVEQSVTGNPDDLSADELHRQAWAVIEPRFREPIDRALERFHDAAGTAKATTVLIDVIHAAQQSAIDILLLAEGEQHWGIVDEQTGQVEMKDEDIHGAEELLNYAAIQTLARGGSVYCLPLDRMPDQQPAAARLRFPLPSAEEAGE